MQTLRIGKSTLINFCRNSSAIITRMPPSIRSDYSIRSAPHLFAQVNAEPRVRRLLGEVELCLLWEKVFIPEQIN